MTAAPLPALGCTSASSAAEFALTLPALLVFLFGIIDAGRFAWEYNKAEKRPRSARALRWSRSPVAPALATYDFTGGGAKCRRSDSGRVRSACSAARRPAARAKRTRVRPGWAPWGAPGTQLVARMRQIDPAIQDTNVQVEYRGSGVGFAGDPTGMDIVPIVTVQLTGMTFRPLTLLSIKVMNMPDFHSSLTAEDSIGTQSN